jgi:2-polyprenyl-3-methyl-5-hydroxy-6-metoxy-1,4-benzoquinol methylase
MFGERVDYLILRTVAHRRNLAAEEELDNAQSGSHSLDEGMLRLRKYICRFQGKFPISAELRYLDMGCGTGELSIALARQGCRHVTGVDFLPRSITHAKKADVNGTVDFICQDLNTWLPAHRYDVLISIEAFEHIEDPGRFLQKMKDFLAPGGVAVLAFGPLFHSPLGDHMDNFFRFPMPWRGVLFSAKAILRLRTECYRPTDPAKRYQDIVGGLNLMRYSEFLDFAREAGWGFSFIGVNVFLKRFPPCYYLSNMLSRIPVVRDYCVQSVYAILQLVQP